MSTKSTHIVAEPSSESISDAEWRSRQIERNQAAIRLLESSLVEGDSDEQRETWEWLRKALDEDRLSDRKLFP